MTKWTISLIHAFFLLYSCSDAQNITPRKYQNHFIVKQEIYDRHKFSLQDTIRKLIEEKDGPYYPIENDSLTQIFIDTILYSPSKNKLAFFVITKNSNDKLLSGGNKNEYHFDAHCFIGYLDSDYKINSITWVIGYNLSNYKTYEEVSARIKQIYFKELSTRTNNKDESTYKYNFDDIRFWEGPLWHDQ
jgi:hypothetical protein